MLTPRQLESLANIKNLGITTKEGAIAFYENKLSLPNKRSVAKSKDRSRSGRKHSRKYYREIIDFLKEAV